MAVDIKLPEGTQVGDWTIRDELGRGGQGVVWGAKSRTTKRHPPKALKACFTTDPIERARFEREIALLRQCRDVPNVLRITDADATWVERVPGVPAFAFYVAERCEGSLEDRVARLGDAGARLELFREACTAVQHLHAFDPPVIHRDIKPANFLIALEPRRLVLADFGIARPLTTDDKLTQPQEVVGSQYFRAPEVLNCEPTTIQSDIYSLGRVLEWLLTGDVSRDLGTRPLARGDRLSDEACDVLDKIIATATQAVTSKRYASVADLVAALPDLWLAIRPRVVSAGTSSSATPLTASEALQTAIAQSKADDRAGWRTTEQCLKQAYIDEILRWRKENENPSIADNRALLEWVANMVTPLMSRLSFALGGLLSQKDPFVDQRRTMDQLIDIPGWNDGGSVISASAPRMIGFVFHYLHGALASELDRFDLALQFAQVQVADPDEDRQRPIWRSLQLGGRPKSLGGKSSLASEFMRILYSREPALLQMFGSQRDYEVAFAAYSLLLSLVEMADSADQTAALTEEQVRSPLLVEVPPMFIALERDVIRAAVRRTIGNPIALQAIMSATKTNRAQIERAWPKWKRVLNSLQRTPWPDELPLGELASVI